jgi:hypothetical protein
MNRFHPPFLLNPVRDDASKQVSVAGQDEVI